MNQPLNFILKEAISKPFNEEIIVTKSTPVISFGDFRTSRVVTIGINPSPKEFEISKDILLKGRDKRLEDFESLNVNSRNDMTINHGKQIFESCCNYFKNTQNVYSWFNKLNPFLEVLDCSYYDGSASHLDLTKWATKNKWQDLVKSDKEKLIENCRPFLNFQLQSENLKYILLNGKQVINEFEKLSSLKYVDIAGLGGKRASMVYGRFNEKVKVIGWSTNIQSSFGVTTEHVEDIKSYVREFSNK